jgi:hypothetical protein
MYETKKSLMFQFPLMKTGKPLKMRRMVKNDREAYAK